MIHEDDASKVHRLILERTGLDMDEVNLSEGQTLVFGNPEFPEKMKKMIIKPGIGVIYTGRYGDTIRLGIYRPFPQVETYIDRLVDLIVEFNQENENVQIASA